MTEEKREQKRANMRPVHVRVGHDDDLAVADFFRIELVVESGADGRDDGPHFVVRKNARLSGLLDVEDLSLQGEDRLEIPVARLLGAAARTVALDQVDLRVFRVAVAAVGQFARQGATVENALPPGHVPGLTHRFACYSPAC